jgi:hypothetical protein
LIPRAKNFTSIFNYCPISQRFSLTFRHIIARAPASINTKARPDRARLLIASRITNSRLRDQLEKSRVTALAKKRNSRAIALAFQTPRWQDRRAFDLFLVYAPLPLLFYTDFGVAKRREYDQVVPPRFLYRYRPLHDEFSSLQQMFEFDKWWFGSRKKFDDEKEDMVFPGYDFEDQELSRRASEDTQRFMDKTGVLCLSSSAKHPKLWELYAAAGEGVCIKLESDFIVDPDNGPFRVNYSDDPKPLWRAFRDNPDPTLYLLRKKRRWSYQSEWRCVLKWNPDEEPTVGPHPTLTKRALAGLIFGWGTTADDRLEILRRLNGGRWWRKPGLREPLRLELQEARLIGGSIQLFDWRPSA